MERVTVVSRVCGCALFDWIAEQSDGGEGALWSAEQRRPTATAAIVAIFSQFAKDLGGTSVVRVRFDQPAAALAQSDASSANSASATTAPTSVAALAASKRPSTRTFSRYGQTIHNRALFTGPAGGAGRRPTTSTVNGSPLADDDGRGSVATVASAYGSSPFAQPGSTQQQPSSPTSPPLAASSTHSSPLSDAGAAVRFDMHCADNDAVLIAAFVTPMQQHHSSSGTGAPYFASHSDVEAACVKLRDAFQSRFNSQLQQMHNTFMAMARNSDEVRSALPTHIPRASLLLGHTTRIATLAH